MEESERAENEGALKAAGHRFGRVLGDNGARVLVVVALTALGGKTAMAARGPRMPGFTQAAARAQREGGFLLPGVLAGEVRSIALPAEGVLNVVLAPTAVAAVAMGPGGGIQGDPDGEVHHICTDKNEVSDASGGPWTPAFTRWFKRAGMELSDPANQVRIRGHKGPHPREYHEEVFRRLQAVMNRCRNTAQCRTELVDELTRIAKELTTAGTKLRKLITKNPEA
ncbi:AHH domain-containing protein [Melittangium boletus]|uniref:AHH domain-containing protein n=1 Tax=Melittangium boletus TaxID=83453 RepID=UPI00269B471E